MSIYAVTFVTFANPPTSKTKDNASADDDCYVFNSMMGMTLVVGYVCRIRSETILLSSF